MSADLSYLEPDEIPGVAKKSHIVESLFLVCSGASYLRIGVNYRNRMSNVEEFSGK